jgi:hypothetical protein
MTSLAYSTLSTHHPAWRKKGRDEGQIYRGSSGVFNGSLIRCCHGWYRMKDVVAFCQELHRSIYRKRESRTKQTREENADVAVILDSASRSPVTMSSQHNLRLDIREWVEEYTSSDFDVLN